jgi:methionyl-tRNA formyltransferase
VTHPRLLIFGYHLIGVVCLEELIEEGRNIAAVVTHENDPSENTWFPSVEALARRHSLEVRSAKSPNEEAFILWVRDLKPDVIFSFYYRSIIPKAILDIPRLGAYNLHGSLLPKYRGRCPINWVLVHGEKETGLTLHVMTPRADSGDIVDFERFPIGPEDTAKDLFDKAAECAPILLRRSIPLILSGNAPRTPQDEACASVFGGRTPEDGRIDWKAPSEQIFNLIRAVAPPYPGTFTEANRKTFHIWWGKPARREDVGYEPGEIIYSKETKSFVVACGPDGHDRIHVLRCQWGEGKEEMSGDQARRVLEQEGIRRFSNQR